MPLSAVTSNAGCRRSCSARRSGGCTVDMQLWYAVLKRSDSLPSRFGLHISHTVLRLTFVPSELRPKQWLGQQASSCAAVCSSAICTVPYSLPLPLPLPNSTDAFGAATAIKVSWFTGQTASMAASSSGDGTAAAAAAAAVAVPLSSSPGTAVDGHCASLAAAAACG
jgi:hypothetical protein